MECALKESGADDLTVITSTGSELKVAKSEVRKVETEDGIRNGVLIGAAVDFAGPVIVTLASGVDKTEVPLGLAIGVIGTGVGDAVAICWTKNAREPKCFTRPLISPQPALNWPVPERSETHGNPCDDERISSWDQLGEIRCPGIPSS